MDSDILYIDHHNPDPPVRYSSADEEAVENSDGSTNANDIIDPIVDDQAPEQNDSVAESSDQTTEQNDSVAESSDQTVEKNDPIGSSDEQVITTDEATEMKEDISTTAESDKQEEEAAPKEANTEDHTPDPFDEIQLKMMGYPLPTPEVSNLKPPLPPNANSETK
ncbi:hypothetical protein IKQ74_02540 [Candidatus Saccharibacteria bacterium]|nr:hypothetical protein [Candidatus Saccharibacteria bacterium]